MGGNSIINLGDSNKPNDAVSRRFVFKKIQNVIKDYDLEDIKVLKKTLEEESENIIQLTNDFKQNEKTIIELQGKIEKEMETLSNAIKDLDIKDDQIIIVLRENIVIINKQIRDLKESMIKHSELKEKITEAEKKLQNMYQLEIRTEISKLNQDTEKRNNDLLNTFLSKHTEFKAELEKSASTRGDIQNVELKSLKDKLKDQQDLLNTFNTNHTEILQDLQDKSAKQGESINSINNQIDNQINKQIINQEKNIANLDDLTKNILPKRITDIGEVVLNLVNDNKKFKRKLSKLDKVIYEIPVFELYNNRVQEVKILSMSVGIPIEYGMKVNELNETVITNDLFALLGLTSSPIINYLDYVVPNHQFEIKRGITPTGFQIKKRGRYTFEIKLIAKGNIKRFILYCTSGTNDPESRIEYIEKDVENEFTLELDPDMFLFIYPEITDSQFTIEAESYVKVTYSWKYII